MTLNSLTEFMNPNQYLALRWYVTYVEGPLYVLVLWGLATLFAGAFLLWKSPVHASDIVPTVIAPIVLSIAVGALSAAALARKAFRPLSRMDLLFLTTVSARNESIRFLVAEHSRRGAILRQSLMRKVMVIRRREQDALIREEVARRYAVRLLGDIATHRLIADTNHTR